MGLTTHQPCGSSSRRAHRLDEAIAQWRAHVGADRVDESTAAEDRYGVSATGLSRRIAAAIRPASRAQVAAIVSIARNCKVSIYPISTGRNWGYGAALPVEDDCAVLDLSDLAAIRTIDPDLGLFEVEPGVTQGALAHYLQEHQLAFMVPTTGAGPDASLVGNALERGYGITPIADHFAAVTRIEAVLPDGRLYVPALSAFGTELIDHAFKWGIGPYLDGLFTQSSFGVVTAMTLALVRRPERVEAFYFVVRDPAKLPEALVALRTILRELGSIAGSVNVMNQHRVLAMVAPYDLGGVGADGLLTEQAVTELGRRFRVDPWMGAGALYGAPEIVAAARRIVRRRLAGVAHRLTFMTLRRARLLRNVGRRVLGKKRAAGAMLDRIAAALEILEGRPNRMAHPVVYWRRGAEVDIEAPLDPARDGCGLIWYAPLVPFVPQVITAYVERCTAVLRAHGMEPLITLSTLSDRCLDSSVPLLFDARKPREIENAHRCYDALIEMGKELGVAPYRLHVGAMGHFARSGDTFWDVVHTLKKALDPDAILSPGRYVAPSCGVTSDSDEQINAARHGGHSTAGI